MLAVPLRGQFEQVLNARYLAREGYGMSAEVLDAARVAEFIERLPEYQSNLARYQQDGNAHLLAGLKASLAAAVRG